MQTSCYFKSCFKKICAKTTFSHNWSMLK